MGQQQLLFIVLGVIMVGIAVVMGMSLFRAQSIEAKRNNVLHDCISLAALAQQYYLKPTQYGGGGRSFTGWTIPTNLDSTANGFFQAVVSSGDVVLTGTGNEVVTANDSVKVQVTVYPHNYNIK